MTSGSYDAEVGVVGAGPAGARVAERLAVRGVDVLLAGIRERHGSAPRLRARARDSAQLVGPSPHPGGSRAPSSDPRSIRSADWAAETFLRDRSFRRYGARVAARLGAELRDARWCTPAVVHALLAAALGTRRFELTPNGGNAR